MVAKACNGDPTACFGYVTACTKTLAALALEMKYMES
jgi:hypothetical protein